mmetsp:Transcript_10479/g.26253  ORF Transcript_10479/g.26253 Transcript_10479/m.26253 type:complete len:514 (+) Transcript_10479:169-1710(+)
MSLSRSKVVHKRCAVGVPARVGALPLRQRAPLRSVRRAVSLGPEDGCDIMSQRVVLCPEAPIKELARVFEKDAMEPEFIQAVSETLTSIEPLLADGAHTDTLQRLLEPERVLIFRVPWTDDQGILQVNRGYRVQMNSALGPYKGGLRFHPSVNLSILKFLAFEQTFKNALTGLQLGAGKGGSDFDPKNKSDGEVMRFCQSFMTELHKHIGPEIDVPAGDIGVGGREIGYMYGQYKRLVGKFDAGVLTGKAKSYGGSEIRPEATGYGLVYFLNEMVIRKDIAPSLKGLRCAISGSGNVSQFAAEKLQKFGALVMTLSDSSGTLYCQSGFTEEDLEKICHLKNKLGGRLSEFTQSQEFHGRIVYFAGQKPWQMGQFDVALPCATQNELDYADAVALVESGCMAVGEGANMPSTPEAIAYFEEHKVHFGPAKAANAGGVAVSGLEMIQNAQGVHWSRQEVEEKLWTLMVNIYDQCEEGARILTEKSGGKHQYTLRNGADAMGFLRVAEAMEAQGYV